jgi:hypothetical protein
LAPKILKKETRQHLIKYFGIRFYFSEEKNPLKCLFPLLTEVGQGCQILLGVGYQDWKNVPNEHKMYQMVMKFPKWP